MKIGITRTLVALNFSNTDSGKTLPDVIDLLPAGNIVEGIDGRTWKNPGNKKLIDEFKNRKVHLPIDINHSTEIKAPHGEPSPAQGWIEEIYDDEGALKGKVAWNKEAEKTVGGGQYKYISPAFTYDSNGEIQYMKSAALVNHPNFTEQSALNSEIPSFDEGENMKEIAKALGLPEESDEKAIVTAINSLKEEKNKTALNMADFIPRADYNLALNRAETAEKALKDKADSEFETALNAEIERGVKAGKIAPASRGFYEKTVTTQEGLKELKSFIDSTPEVVAVNSESPEKKPKGKKVALNAEQKAVRRALGYEDDDENED